MPKLLAFVDIFVESPEMDSVLTSLAELDHLEELYEVTGEFDIVTLVSADDIEEFRDILKNKIMKIKGVKSTVSSIVLKAHKGPKCIDENRQTATQLLISINSRSYLHFVCGRHFQIIQKKECRNFMLRLGKLHR